MTKEKPSAQQPENVFKLLKDYNHVPNFSTEHTPQDEEEVRSLNRVIAQFIIDNPKTKIVFIENNEGHMLKFSIRKEIIAEWGLHDQSVHGKGIVIDVSEERIDNSLPGFTRTKSGPSSAQVCIPPSGLSYIKSEIGMEEDPSSKYATPQNPPPLTPQRVVHRATPDELSSVVYSLQNGIQYDPKADWKSLLEE